MLASLNWLDYILIVVLLASAAAAFRKGFSREIIGLTASILALVLAMWFYGLAGSFFRPLVDSDRVANLIGFVSVLIAVWILGALCGWIVHRFLRSIGLSFFDRLLGAGFGLIRGTLIATALLTGYMAFGPHENNASTPNAVVHSQIAPYLLQASRLFVAVAPMDLKTSFREHYQKVRSAWQAHTEENGRRRISAQ